MSHWIWPLVVIMLACLGVDLASDLWLKPRPGSQADAEAWSFALWLLIIACFAAMVFIFIKEALA